jgi:hypothetical protein
MARGTAIEDFADKLRLALGRANLSRTALAQLVGVDKSVVARWASGALHPADHSLATLSAALGRALPGFDRTAWDLPLSGFAERLGVRGPQPATLPALSAADAMLGPLLRHPGPSSAAAYVGLWVALFGSSRGRSRLSGLASRLTEVPGSVALRMEAGDLGTVLWEGWLLALGPKLYSARRAVGREDAFSFGVLVGVATGRAAILEGFSVARDLGQEAAPAALPTLHFRISDRVDDAAFDAARRIAGEHTRHGAWESLLPPALLARYRFPSPPPPAPTVLRRSLVESWATQEEELDEPMLADRREAVDVIRSLFAPALAEQQG